MKADRKKTRISRAFVLMLGLCLLAAATCMAVMSTASAEVGTLNKTDLCLEIGETDTVTVSGGGTLTLTSADPSVVRIDGGDMVAVSVGKTTVNAECDGQRVGTVNVEVVERKKRVDDNICISIFWPPNFTVFDAEDEDMWKEQFKLMQDAEIDLINSTFYFDYDLHLKYAKYSYEYDILYSMCGPDFGRAILSLSESEVRELIARFRNVPGVVGYYLKDEPVNPNDYANVYKWAKETDPDSYPHVNLLPYWYSGYADMTQYKSIANDWLKLNKAMGYTQDYLMYDLYPYGPGTDMNRNWFFNNISAIHDVGLLNGVKTGNYLQSVWVGTASGTEKYRATTPAEIRYEAMAGLAYGLKQLSYFTWCTSTGNEAETFAQGIILPDGTPNPKTYDGVAKLNKDIHTLGKTLINLDALEVYLNGNTTWGQPKIPQGFFAQPNDDTSYIASFMRNAETGRNYLMVVNNDFAKPATVSLTLDSRLSGLTRISPEDGSRLPVSLGGGNTLSVQLAAGDGALYELPEGFDYYVPREARPGENLAAESNIGANSSLGTGYHYIDKMIDGERKSSGANRTNGWRSTKAVSDSAPAIITFDLGVSADVNRIDMYPYGSKREYGAGFPKDFTIEVSADGTNYTTAYTAIDYEISGADMSGAVGIGKGQKFGFTASETRYIRIVITEADGNYAALAEIEVYADDGTVPDPEQFELVDTGVGQAGDGAQYDSNGWYNGNLNIDQYLSYVKTGDRSIIGSYAENKVLNNRRFTVSADDVCTVSFEMGIEYENDNLGHRFIYFFDADEVNGYRDFTYNNELVPMAFFINKKTHEMQVFINGNIQILANGENTVTLDTSHEYTRYINQNRKFVYHYISAEFDWSETKFNQPAYVSLYADGDLIVKAEIASDSFPSGNMQIAAQFWGGGGSPYVEFSPFDPFVTVKTSMGGRRVTEPMKIMDMTDDIHVLLSKPATTVRVNTATGGTANLTEGADYTANGNEIVIKKSYLQSKAIGYFPTETVFTFVNAGQTATAQIGLLYHNPPEYTQGKALTVKEALTADVKFDVAYERDETYTMTLDGNPLDPSAYSAVYDSGAEKIAVTIGKESINGLSHGSHDYALVTSGGKVTYTVYRNLYADEWLVASEGNGYGQHKTGAAYNNDGTASLTFLPLSRIYYSESLNLSKTLYFTLETEYGEYNKDTGWLAFGLVNDVSQVGTVTENNDGDRFVFLYAPDSGRFQVIGVKGTSRSGMPYYNETGAQLLAVTVTAENLEIQYNGHTVFKTTERNLDTFENGCYLSLFFSANVYVAKVPAVLSGVMADPAGQTYTPGSEKDIKVNLVNAREVTGVKYGDVSLAADDYSYAGGVLTVYGSFLKDLEVTEALQFTVICGDEEAKFTIPLRAQSNVDYDRDGWADLSGSSTYVYADSALTVTGNASLRYRETTDLTAAGGAGYTVTVSSLGGYYKMGQSGSVNAYAAITFYDEESGHTVTFKIYANDTEKSGNYQGMAVLSVRTASDGKVFIGDDEVRDATCYSSANVFGDNVVKFAFADGTLVAEWGDEVLYLDTGDTTDMTALRFGVLSDEGTGTEQNAFRVAPYSEPDTPVTPPDSGDNQPGGDDNQNTQPGGDDPAQDESSGKKKCGCGSFVDSPASALGAAAAFTVLIFLCAVIAKRRRSVR